MPDKALAVLFITATTPVESLLVLIANAIADAVVPLVNERLCVPWLP